MSVNLLQNVLDVLLALVQFIVKLVGDLVMVITLLGQSILRLPLVLGFLPSVCVSIVMATFSIVIIYKVIGREG